MSVSRLVVAALGLVALATLSQTAVSRDDPPRARWEYGELYHHERSGTFTGPDKKVFVPAVEWVSGVGSVRGYGWDGMAEKLKAPAPKPEAAAGSDKDAGDAVQRLRVLNHLGDQGWELISHGRNESNGTSRWLFKRRVGK